MQLRHAEKIIEHHARHGLLLEYNHHAHAHPVRLIIDVAYALKLMVVHQLGYPRDHLRLIHLVGNLRHDDARPPARGLLNLRARPHHDAPPPGPECVLHPRDAVNNPPRGEIRPLHVLHQLIHRHASVVNVRADRVHHLAKIMRCHIRGHPHRNARRPIHQQLRNTRGQHHRLLERLIEVRHEIHRILVQIFQHILADPSQTRLRVPHGRRAIPIHRAKIALPKHERVAQRPILRHAHHRIVHRHIAMRMVLSQHLSHDTCRLLRGRVVRKPQPQHPK